MKKAIVYPFDQESLPVLRHRECIAGYEITGLVLLERHRTEEYDKLLNCDPRFPGIVIGNRLDALLDSCDTVIIPETCIPGGFEKELYADMRYIMERGKNIVCLTGMDEPCINGLLALSAQKGVSFEHYSKSRNNPYQFNESIHEESILDINTPVIFVLGLAERTNKFEIQLSLRNEFRKMGYKVGQIGSRHYCELLGFQSFPGFMFDTGLTEAGKVVRFNRFVKEIENQQAPDVIIVGVPGGIMPFNARHTNRFGILAYETAQAITPDAAVLSVLYEDYKPDFFKELSTSVRYKLGFEIDCYNLANTQVDWVDTVFRNTLSYIKIAPEFIDGKKYQDGLETPVYNVLNGEDPCKMAKYLVDRISEDEEMMII